jgi:hypothetical protein
MSLKRQLLNTILAWVCLGVFLAVSAPGELPVVALIVPFILLFVATYSSWNLIQQIRIRYLARGKVHRRLGLVVCACAVLLLVLQSLGQLTLRDVITVAAIVFLGYVYVGRVSFGLPKS